MAERIRFLIVHQDALPVSTQPHVAASVGPDTKYLIVRQIMGAGALPEMPDMPILCVQHVHALLEGSDPQLIVPLFQGQNGQSATLVVAAQGDMLEKARGAVKKVQAPAVSAHIDVPVAGFCKRSHLWRTEPQGVKRIVLDQVEETQVPVELADAALV